LQLAYICKSKAGDHDGQLMATYVMAGQHAMRKLRGSRDGDDDGGYGHDYDDGDYGQFASRRKLRGSRGG
jgi:hypothetical protein